MDILFPSYVCPIYLGRFRIVIGLRFLLQSYPHSQASYRISVRQTRCLPLASFRFRLAADTLAFGCNLPTIRAILGLAPFRVCSCWTNKKDLRLFSAGGLVIEWDGEASYSVYAVPPLIVASSSWAIL